MSIANLRFTKGAPDSLEPGMVMRCRGNMVLVGTFTPPSVAKAMLADCTEYAQAISDYQLEWLGNMGIPAKAAQ